MKPAFAITANKTQVQTMTYLRYLSISWSNTSNDWSLLARAIFFGHGQLYVALSRVEGNEILRIYQLMKDNATVNVVYPEILNNYGKINYFFTPFVERVSH